MASKLSESVKSEWADAFNMFDADGDGCITVSELIKVLHAMGVMVTESEAKNMLDEVDTDNDGTIDLEEFDQMMSKRNSDEVNELELLKAFQVFDKNSDGFIDTDELMGIMLNLGEGISREEATEMLNMADLNGDGKVDYKEFIKMMLTYSQPTPR